jgi:hypothetical protein
MFPQYRDQRTEIAGSRDVTFFSYQLTKIKQRRSGLDATGTDVLKDFFLNV